MNKVIIKKLIQILNNRFLIQIQNLNIRYNFYKDLQMNYLEQMEMLLYIEREFKIDIDDREIHTLYTVRDLVACIEKHLNFKSVPSSNLELKLVNASSNFHLKMPIYLFKN